MGSLGKALEPTSEDQDEQNDENDAKAAARVVTPICAVRPAWQRADHKQHENDKENAANTHC